MKVVGDYERDGYALIKGLIDPRIGQLFLQRLMEDRDPRSPGAPDTGEARVLERTALQVHGCEYPPMLFFLWGLTPLVSFLAGRDLLPAYDFFRIYREADVLRVHSDREACEHSMSLTLAYSDGRPWPLEIGHRSLDGREIRVTDDFSGEEYSSIVMEPGDAVLYRGVHRRHGRTRPNPNCWSAHLFLHWVDRDGPCRDYAFEGANFAMPGAASLADGVRAAMHRGPEAQSAP